MTTDVEKCEGVSAEEQDVRSPTKLSAELPRHNEADKDSDGGLAAWMTVAGAFVALPLASDLSLLILFYMILQLAGARRLTRLGKLVWILPRSVEIHCIHSLHLMRRSFCGLLLADYYARVYLSNWSASSIGWISSVQLFLSYVVGPFVGVLFDRGYFLCVIAPCRGSR